MAGPLKIALQDPHTCLPVLLDHVALVIELGEGGSQLVQVVTEGVQQEVVMDTEDDLCKLEQVFGEGPLLGVTQVQGGGPACGG